MNEFIQINGRRVAYDGSCRDLYATLERLDVQAGDQVLISKDGYVDSYLIHGYGDGSIWACPEFPDIVTVRFPIRL